jgi:UDP-N-acetylglucosamine--N-acetylmuramyl-(pentapeptide) pyrophosphoryl-undecaprenol N-acetylglucosamine transferase
MDAPHLPARTTELPGFLVRLARAVGSSLRDLRARRPDLVVGLGGYASVGPGLAALLSGRPLLLLEQNAVPGKANRLLARLGGRLAAAYPESLSGLPARARSRARVVGNPVRPELLSGRRDPGRFGLSPDAPILLVTGGSQGAEGLNRAVAEAAPILARRGVQAIHLAGESGATAAREAWARAGARAYVVPFTREMGDAYATADLVLCRAGGTTVAELAALGKPAVLVPYPHHADRHQERNARALVAAGAARLVPEAELTPERVERDVADLIGDREALGRMGRAAARLGVPDAADRAAGFAAEIMGGGRG